MSTYKPNNFVIVKMTDSRPDALDPVMYKVLGGWNGGYAFGSSWRMNSGITKVRKVKGKYHLHGYSGSVYEVHPDTNFESGAMSSALQPLEVARKMYSTFNYEVITFKQFLKEFKSMQKEANG